MANFSQPLHMLVLTKLIPSYKFSSRLLTIISFRTAERLVVLTTIAVAGTAATTNNTTQQRQLYPQDSSRN